MSAAEDWAAQQAERERLDSAAWHTNHEPPGPNGHRGAPSIEGDAADHLRSNLLRGADIAKLPKPVPLIAGFLDLDSLAVLYGPSGSGKSFVALDWALSVATGTWWLHHEVAPGPVLYVIAEGATGFGERVASWLDNQRLHDIGDRIHWLPLAVDLRNSTWAPALATVARELNPQLVIIDTLARSMVGADENSARDMGQAVDAVDRIRRATRACCLIVHHTGKNLEAGARGHSALTAAVDTSISCAATDQLITLEVQKQKNHAGGTTLQLTLATIGDSCAVQRHHGLADGSEMTTSMIAVLQALDDIDTGDGVSGTLWHEASGLAKSTFYRHLKRLVGSDHVHKEGTKNAARFSLTDHGRRQLAPPEEDF